MQSITSTQNGAAHAEQCHRQPPEDRHRQPLPAEVRLRLRPADPPRPRHPVRCRLSARRARTPPTSASTRPTSGRTAAAGRRPAAQELDRGPRLHPRERADRAQGRGDRGRRGLAPADPAHTEADANSTATPESGRPWASGQLVFNAGSFESARSAFADYAKDGETGTQLRARVNRIILEDLEEKVLALRALHAKLRDLDGGESFGDVVARSRPRPRGECGD